MNTNKYASKRNVFTVVLLLSTSLLFSCNPTTPEPQPEPEPVVPEEKVVTPISLLSPVNNEVVSTYTSSIDTYLDATTDNDRIIALRNGKGTNAGATPVDLKWETNGSANYTVTVSTNGDLSNPQTYLVSGISPVLHLYNLIPNTTYYWAVKGNEKNDTSKTLSFKTADKTLRYIYASGGNNMRDLGGWKTLDGKSINYGKLYRGNCLNGYSNIAKLTSEGIDTFVNQLGMKTEIDLRTSGSDDLNQNSNWFREDGKYLKATIGQYTQLFDPVTWNAIKEEHPEQVSGSGPNIASVTSIKQIFECLADENNYPIYMHCNLGADRTGSMAFLINGLLGVPYENLVQDYELTTYCSASGERYRSEVILNETTGEYTFSESGVCPSTGNFIAFGAFYQNMMKYYGENSTLSLSQAIQNYLNKYIGVSNETISKVKNILIKDYHDSTYDNVKVLSNRQDIDLSLSTKSIKLDGCAYKNIKDIDYCGISLGTDINNLDFSKMGDVSGEDYIFVHAVDLEDKNVIFKVPVTFVTEIINDLERFKEIFDNYQNNTYFGYYKLGCDIGSENDTFSDKKSFDGLNTWTPSLGFNGTLDGCGHTISGSSSYFGLFSVLGSNSCIKNLNIENYKYVSGAMAQHTTLAISIFGKLENINVKVHNGPTSVLEVSNWKGLLCTSFCKGMTLNNVGVDAEGFYLDTLFGGTNTGGFFASTNSFNNLVLKCNEIKELGHYGSEQYSMFSVSSLGGAFAVTSTQKNETRSDATSAQIYLGSEFESGFVVDKIEYNGNNVEITSFEDGEATIVLGSWFPKDETSMTLKVKLKNSFDLDLTVLQTVSIIQSN